MATRQKPLQQMILQLSAAPRHDRSNLPVLNPDFLGHRDGHMVHIAPVPDRLENGVREPKCQQVLDGFLAQVMIDSEIWDFLLNVSVREWFRLRADSRSCPIGFSTTMRARRRSCARLAWPSKEAMVPIKTGGTAR